MFVETLYCILQEDDIECVQALVAFDADVNAQNKEGHTPVDLAITIGRKQYIKHTVRREETDSLETSWQLVSTDPDAHGYESLEKHSEMVRLLKSVGAIESESAATVHVTTSEMPPISAPANQLRCAVPEESERSKCLYKDLEDHINERWADMMSLHNVDEMVAIEKQKKEIERYKRTGSRVLCLDGGGMKGLIEIEILSQIEQVTGRRITELFDWIVATSTGAVIALGLVYGG